MSREKRQADRPPCGLVDLAKLARRARRRAHAPYSGFRVGAALRTSRGEIVTGCNIENASFGLSLCAERVAVFKAVSEGLRRFDAVAIVADARQPTPPCGPCRQILWEFCGDIWVHMVGSQGRSETVRLSSLLPMPFDGSSL
jgi:cytidine deaminase